MDLAYTVQALVLDEAAQVPKNVTETHQAEHDNAALSFEVSIEGHPDEGYQYEPLPSERHIRVLTLKSAPCLEDAIECDIETITIGPDADYNPLSYSWAMQDGDATPSREIWICGKRMKITQNLFEGLRRIRSHADGDLRTWIDAVCINQTDLDERSAHVAMMADVYKNGRKTIIWIGEGDPEEDESAYRLFRHLRGVGEARLSAPLNLNAFQALSHEGVDETCTFGTDKPCQHCDGPLIGPDITRDCREIDSLDIGLRDLLGRKLNMARGFHMRRYWTRRWIVQEVLSSSAKEILWGPFLMDGQDLRSTTEIFFWAYMGRFKCTVMSERAMEEIEPVMENLYWGLGLADRHNGLRSLPSLLFDSRFFECSDPRDVIYSLISLDPRSRVRPDYSLAAQEVFVRSAQALIQNGFWTFVFLSCRGLTCGSGDLSWVPEFALQDVAYVDRDRRREPLSVMFNSDRSLTLSVYYVSTIKQPVDPHSACYETMYRPVSKDPKGGRRRSSRGPRTTYQVAYASHWADDRMQSGDKICALQRRVRYGQGQPGMDVLIGLRSVYNRPGTYCIAFSLDVSAGWDVARVKGAPRRAHFPESDRMTVRII